MDEMNDRQTSRLDQILNLLVEEIEERMHARAPRPPAPAPPADADVLAPSAAAPPGMPEEPVGEAAAPEEAEPELERPSLPPAPSHASRLMGRHQNGAFTKVMGRLALGLLLALVLINIPFNRHGTTLATAMPDSAALVIRDGLVVKEQDDEKIYVYQDGRFRWISSLDAFEHFDYTWGDVHIVEDGFLDRYEIGPPLHVLLKCRTSPHIYRMEGGEKRWIRDIETFDAEGHVWEDVRFVSCGYLRDLPDGETIPPGYGPPPQP